MANNPNFPFTGVSDDAGLADQVGQVQWDAAAGKAYRLVVASANIAAAVKKTVVSALSSGDLTWSCTTTTTAALSNVAGVIPATLTTTSSTSGQIDSGQYFWVQVSGTAVTISAAAVALAAAVGTSTTAGKIDDATMTVGGTMGYALETAAGADEDLYIRLALL